MTQNETTDAVPATGMPPDLRVFSYAVAEKAEMYVATVEVLTAARERFRLQLRPVEVARDLQAAGIGVEIDEVNSLLEALTDWGNLSHTYDGTAPETLAEFYGKRFLYQLTPAGTSAHEGVRAVRRTALAGGGRLSGVLLPGIVDRLEAIGQAAHSDEADAARLYSMFVDLFGAFGELAENAARYMSDLAVQVSELAGDDQRFVTYKHAVFAYLNDFVARFTEVLPRIQQLVATLDPVMHDLLAVAASADAAPTLAGVDQGPRAELEQRWAGVYGWFLPERDRQPVAESLQLAMLEALNRILMAVTRINERHLRRASREADFVQLAHWFATPDGAADDPHGHLLWDHAFGLWGARHFSDAAGDEEIERRRSFWDAEPAEIAPRLRATGRRTSPVRPGKAADYRATKLARVAAVRRLHAQAAAAVRRLAGRTPVRLSDLGELDPEEFGQFLALLDAALAAPTGPDGSRMAATPTFVVVLRPMVGAADAEIRTRAGTLRCSDHHLFIDLGDARRVEAVG